jgi:hypothetical protein
MRDDSTLHAARVSMQADDDISWSNARHLPDASAQENSQRE